MEKFKEAILKIKEAGLFVDYNINTYSDDFTASNPGIIDIPKIEIKIFNSDFSLAFSAYHSESVNDKVIKFINNSIEFFNTFHNG